MLKRPQELHRLDAETGGLLICAKTQAAAQALSRAFADRTLQKRYRALVRGALAGCGRVTAPLSGKACVTEWRVAAQTRSQRCDVVTTVDLWPRTGRTHQLRKHMAMIGHPILGDVAYWRLPQLAGADAARFHERIERSELLSAPEATDAPAAAATNSRAAPVEPVCAACESDDALNVPRQQADTGSDEPDRKRARPMSGACGRENGGAGPETSMAGSPASGLSPGSAAPLHTGHEREASRDECTAAASGGAGAPDAEGVAGCDATVRSSESTNDAPAVSGPAFGAARAAKQEETLAERMCLWKLQCRFAHPAHGGDVDVCIAEPELFERVRTEHRTERTAQAEAA